MEKRWQALSENTGESEMPTGVSEVLLPFLSCKKKKSGGVGGVKGYNDDSCVMSVLLPLPWWGD